MIIISSAMGKSGSTLLCNLPEDMLAVSGVRSGQQKLRALFKGRFIKVFSFQTVMKLIFINFRYGTIAIKTHTPPTRYVRWLIKLGFARATFSFHDVRDVVLSVLDHGARNRREGKTNGIYADLFPVEDALHVGLHAAKVQKR